MNVPFARRVPLANQARGYQEELDRRRDQELRDEALARRIQFLGLRADGDDIYNADAGLGPLDDDLFLNRDFARRAADIISGTYNTAGVRAAERLGADLQQRPRTHAAEPHDTNLRQEHTPASREYNNRASTRPSERVVPRRVTTDYETEAARHRPVEIAEPRRASLLAGISRGQTVEGRVDEWRRHVDPLAFGVTPPPI